MDYNKSKAFDLDILKESDRNGKDRLHGKQSLKEYSNNDILNGFAPPKIRDIICFSHLRWNFVFQRPQHLLTRWAKEVRVFYIEEPISGNFESNFLKTVYSKNLNLTVITPHVKDKYTEKEVNAYLKESVNEIIRWYEISDYLLWYLTPMAVEFTIHLDPKLVVYDSMDELSCFKGAHPNILPNEKLLFRLADVVFTGGYTFMNTRKTGIITYIRFQAASIRGILKAG